MEQVISDRLSSLLLWVGEIYDLLLSCLLDLLLSCLLQAMQSAILTAKIEL